LDKAKEVETNLEMSEKKYEEKLDEAKREANKVIETAHAEGEKLGGEMKDSAKAEVEKLVRAMYPWPGAWTFIRLSTTDEKNKRLKILKVHLEDEKLILDEVQLEGKEPVTWKQFKEGYKEATFEEAA